MNADTLDSKIPKNVQPEVHKTRHAPAWTAWHILSSNFQKRSVYLFDRAGKECLETGTDCDGTWTLEHILFPLSHSFFTSLPSVSGKYCQENIELTVHFHRDRVGHVVWQLRVLNGHVSFCARSGAEKEMATLSCSRALFVKPRKWTTRSVKGGNFSLRVKIQNVWENICILSFVFENPDGNNFFSSQKNENENMLSESVTWPGFRFGGNFEMRPSPEHRQGAIT